MDATKLIAKMDKRVGLTLFESGLFRKGEILGYQLHLSLKGYRVKYYVDFKEAVELVDEVDAVIMLGAN